MRDDLPENWPAGWKVPAVKTGELLTSLRAEAFRLVVSQQELIRGGVLTEPSETVLKRIVAFHRSADFMNRAVPYIDEVNELIAKLQRRGPR